MNLTEHEDERIIAIAAAIDTGEYDVESSLDELTELARTADAEIAEIIRQKAQTNANPQPSAGESLPGITSNATWAYPVAGGSYISSGYGQRDASISGWGFHGGIDITGGGFMGTPIYATRAGTVIAANYGTTGYGNYVIIDHGDGYTSLYGHCSALLVSQGQRVSRGQIIAQVGNTGWSTGPHLHFEVRYNGETVDPLDYVNIP